LLKRHVICAVAAALLGLGVLGPGPARADLVLNVSVQTSPLSAQSGYLDFQFNPGDSSALPATASVSGFQSVGGTLAPTATLTGDASGSLPGTVTLNNSTPFNDAFQGFTFGDSFSFTLTLSGPAVDNPGGTTGSAFALSLYAADGITPLLTTDPNGSVATIDLNANGTATIYTFSESQTDSTHAATVTLAGAVPEPSALTLLAFAVACAGLIKILRGGNEKRSLATR
jgi:hypothetical protein